MVRLALLALVVAVTMPVLRTAGSRLWWLATTALLALFLSFVLEPAVDRLAARGMRRGAAAGVVLGAVVVILGGFAALVGTLMVDQSRTLVASMPDHLERVQTFLDGRGIDVDVAAQYERAKDRLAERAVDLGGTAFSAFGKVVTTLFFAFYLAVDGPRLRRSICSVLPPNRQRLLLNVWKIAIDKTGQFILSRLFLALVSSLVHSVAFSAIGLPSPIPLGLFVGLVSQLIPSFGTYLAAVPPLLVAFTESTTVLIAVLVVIIVYQQIENYLVVPKVQRRIMDIHPALGLGAAIAGVSLLGVPGALLALPVLATVQAFASSYAHRYELVDAPNLPPDDQEPA